MIYDVTQTSFLVPAALDEDTATRLGLTLLLELDGLSNFLEIASHYRNNATYRILELIRLGEEALELDAPQQPLIKQLRATQAALGPFPGSFGPVLDEGLRYLADTLGLAPIEQRILGLATMVNAHGGLSALASKCFGEMDIHHLVRITATLLGEPELQVRAALSPQGLLARSGLLSLDRKERQELPKKFALLEGMAEALCGGAEEVRGLLERWIPSAPASHLGLKDYPHLRAEIRLLRRLLEAGLRQQRRGLNILAYGPPGTGKTELMQALAGAMAVPLYAVPNADEAGDPLNGEQRLRYYRLAQMVLSQREQALLLFDEVEDVFPHPIGIHLGNTPLTKGWINSTLEENPRPTLWVCNGIDGLDPAYLRRFAQIIEVEVPPQAVRERLIRTQTGHLPVSRPWQQRIARHTGLSAAVLQQAVNSVSSLGDRRSEQVEADLERVLNSTLQAMGHPLLPRARASEVMPYRLQCLNADQDLLALEQGLRRDPRARICCYGPSGTGKSAYGAALAERLRRPLLVKRASDLLSPLLGGTEMNLARMFREADQARAVLVLDEADSFLRDRREARAHWEVTQVNELLVQMEAFDGLFIVSTNLIETLDRAALRRFDLKIHFDYLRPEQAWTLFGDCLRQTGGRLTQPQHWQARLADLRGLTPGDFATLVRAQRLASRPLTPQTLYDGLVAEIALKEPEQTRRPIGFAANF
ncbi:AAA family ATPase [Halochromatium roseum]|uniref:AAA family ATPase n=1 Tax=Halochromatium roseum TaxID=391920 RepID=UPI001913311D|nr:AAA family ATPase [Halochromatium roseum]MBK5938244.1 hypothetical protein [Halochromatium roseum]